MACVDLTIIGAGPAGMSAAIAARARGLSVCVVDEQPAPGGQIWRDAERNAGNRIEGILGTEYQKGLRVIAEFRACGCDYRPETQIWHVERREAAFRLFATSDRGLDSFESRRVLFATGAQERPLPFPGWTLPGVMTVGAAQILLKSSRQVPAEPVWIVGTGPLVLLYMVQLLAAGGRIAGHVETSPAFAAARAWRELAAGLFSTEGSRQVRTGLGWQGRLRRAGFPIFRGRPLRAEGQDRLEAFRFTTGRGEVRTVPASLLLLHDGLMPSIHGPLSADCDIRWDRGGRYFSPPVEIGSGATSVPGLHVAGDGARIQGADAAALHGADVAGRIADSLGAVPAEGTQSLRRALARATRLRPFLEACYRPFPGTASPADDALVCRCEEISALDIRKTVGATRMDANQLKALTRCGMGPCQGRQCGHVVSRMLAEMRGETPDQSDLFRIRPPLKPVTLGELASLKVME
ncbi:FAD-dependent oxidoreductase [Celeribacter indicus]|uniref:BFD-like protein n=1 Tax=Celeribacter indicus TaxID=1208324 RepID=A0A0B5E3B8_9RHOB|nr:FAD-dependent oxidoreductase [Celeribacter indicus]AJE47536.1 BFD-like protein [Celeribacter indicus]SDW09535.1 Thioredoxin reductase [Celeribacter indicus]